MGYRAPWWNLNLGSPALLAAHGFLYDSSLMDDDKPYTLSTASVEVPVRLGVVCLYCRTKVGSGVIETCEKAFQLWKEEFDGMYRYGSSFILTMYPEIIGRPARVMMLERLIDYLRSHEGIWLTTCEEIARHQASKQATVEKVLA